MADRVKKQDSAKAAKASELVIAYMDQWEHWRLSGSQAQKLDVKPDLSAINLSNNPTLLIPHQYLNVVDLWILTQDQALVGDMVHLQLENRGVFTNPDEVPIYDYRALGQDQARTLTLTTTLDPSFPEEWALPAIGKFDSSVHYFSFPRNQWTVWREMHRFVAVLCDDKQVVYAQTLSVKTLDQEFAAELRCLSLQLVSDGISPENVGLTFWSPISPEEKQIIETALSLPIQEATRPNPIPPKSSFNLTPSFVRIKQAQSKRFARYRNLIIMLSSLYVIASVTFGIYLYMQKKEVDESIAAIAKNRPVITDIRSTMTLWDQFQPIVDKELHPLYVLKTITNALPTDGVRITNFTQRLFETSIQGEAKNNGLAANYLASINNDNNFPNYKWKGSQPTQNPNNTWTFKQSATHPNAPAKE